MGNSRTALFSAVIRVGEPLSPAAVAVPHKVNWNGFSGVCMGWGECEHVEAGPAPVKEKEGSGPGIMAHLSLSVLRSLITFLQVKLTVTLLQ